MFSFTNVIHIIIVFQGMLLSLYIFLFSRKNLNRNVLLASVTGLLSLQILGIFLINRNIWPDLFGAVNCLYGFLYGPLLLFYTRSVTRSDFSFKRKHLFHSVPFLVILSGVVLTAGRFCQPQLYLVYAAIMLFYIGSCFVEIRRYKKVVRDNYSRLDWLNLDWLQWAFLMFSLIVLADIFQFFAFLLKFNIPQIENVTYILILVFINTLYFKGLRFAGGLTGINKADADLSTSIAQRLRRSITPEVQQKHIEILEAYLEEHTPFKDPDLTIAGLAQDINMSKRSLSELINDHYGQNFVDFINSHRINYAKNRLANPADPGETILEVMYEAGFNSKSAFNVAFKKKTGLTPSQFKAYRNSGSK